MTLVSSPDGQWVAARRGREVSLYASGTGPPVGQLGLEGDDVDLALVGPPAVLVVVTRHAHGTTATLHQLPYLDTVARTDFDTTFSLGAITGSRMAFVSADGKQVTIVRAAGRTLAAQALSVGGPVDCAVGLDRNQVLLSILKKLEVWDAVSGRPLLRLQLQLPPPPRAVGAALGHLWATRPGTEEVFIYRLSDGRPFRHLAGSGISRVICHPASTILVLVTPRGLIRLHCTAHTLTPVEVPWPPTSETHLAQLVHGDEVTLVGMDDSPELWRVSLAAPAPHAHAEPEPVRSDAANDSASSGPRARPQPVARATTTRAPAWRDAVAGYGLELVRGSDAETPVVAVDTELGELAHRLNLTTPARRGLIAVYGAYLAGEKLAIVRLARAIADWNEALGHGELGALGITRSRDGRVELDAAAARLLDGFAPSAIRIAGTTAKPASGITRLERGLRSDTEVIAELTAQLGKIAIVTGSVPAALVEARLLGLPAIVVDVPASEPAWPRDAAAVIVCDDNAPAWTDAYSAIGEGGAESIEPAPVTASSPSQAS